MEFYSRHTGERIDNGIDKAFAADSAVSALSANVASAQNTANSALTTADLAAAKAATAGERAEVGIANADAAKRAIVYDRVIRTQAEFEELYNSSNWLGAGSVAFVGDGGTLEFTRSNMGLKVPSTVKRIDGFNHAKIRINNFVYGATTNMGGIWYEALPTSTEYSMSNISLSVDSSGSGSARGFEGCRMLISCKASVESFVSGSTICFSNCSTLISCVSIGNGTGSGTVNGYYTCDTLSACSAVCTGSGTVNGYYTCNRINDCTASSVSSSSTYATGFFSCSLLNNCTGNASNTGLGVGYAFRNCTGLSNCVGSGEGTSGYSFNTCSFLNGCKEGTILSTTGIWGGTWLFRDDQSCQLVRA